jgi:hypothetical protein
MRKSFAIIAALVLAALQTSAGAQTRRTNTAPAARTTPAAQAANASAGLLAALPASDAVVSIDVRRLLTEAMPRAYAGNAAELARVNSEIDKFKARTGLDARQFERIAFGATYGHKPSGAVSVDAVAIAQGSFNPGALVGAARLASAGKYQETKHAGKTVYVFNVNDQVRLLGLFNVNVTDLAVAQLGADSIAVGKLSRVQQALDAASTGRGRLSAEITALATRTPNAVVGFGGNVPQESLQNIELLNPEFSRSVASIRQFYGAVGTTDRGFLMQTVLRTLDSGSAKTLSDTVAGLKMFAPLAIARYPGGKGRALQGVVDSTRVSAQGNEVSVRLDLSESDLAGLIAAF